MKCLPGVVAVWYSVEEWGLELRLIVALEQLFHLVVPDIWWVTLTFLTSGPYFFFHLINESDSAKSAGILWELVYI